LKVLPLDRRQGCVRRGMGEENTVLQRAAATVSGVSCAFFFREDFSQ
jgi:hypothetical protein